MTCRAGAPPAIHTEAEKRVRGYLAKIGRRGGLARGRELTHSHAKQMVAIREAKCGALKAGQTMATATVKC
jgi:hypothetical protein